MGEGIFETDIGTGFPPARNCDVTETLRLVHPAQPDTPVTADTVIPFIHMAGITETDLVLDMTPHSDMLLCALAYAARPKTLIVVDFGVPENDIQGIPAAIPGQWSEEKSLLDHYDHTEPGFLAADIRQPPFAPGTFDCVVGDLAAGHGQAVSEYKTFERLLFHARDILRANGRLVTTVKADWILKSWGLLEELGLQLEYPQWQTELGTVREPDSPVALRFVKKMVIDMPQQRRSVLALMERYSITPLTAHKRNVIFPYAQVVETRADPYLDMQRREEKEQYFFDAETTDRLAGLCGDNTAFLVTPSIAIRANDASRKGVLFEGDGRPLRMLAERRTRTVRPQKYDLNAGLHRLIIGKYLHAHDTVICDPPFTRVKPDILARDIDELLQPGERSAAYVVFPARRIRQLAAAMRQYGLNLEDGWQKPPVRYNHPPRMVRNFGDDAIQIYKFSKN